MFGTILASTTSFITGMQISLIIAATLLAATAIISLRIPAITSSAAVRARTSRP